MNELLKNGDSLKRIIGLIVSLFACFALVIALVPIQAIADNGSQDSTDVETAVPTESSDMVAFADSKEVSIPTPATNLVYTGTAQKLLSTSDGYKIELVKEEGLQQAVDDQTDKTAILATNAGTYKFTVTLNEGYVWRGGGTNDQTVEIVVAPADINKATTAKVPTCATFLGEPVTTEIVLSLPDKTELKEGVDYTVEYVDNDNVGKATAIITGIGNFQARKIVQFEVVKSQVMFRVYNPNSGEHFYTADTAERDSLVKSGWKDEGEAWISPEKSDTPVYRLYSGTDHHYTTSSVERDSLVKAGWKDEGIGWYSENLKTADDAENIHVYRVFNPNVVPTAPTNNSGSHHYTTDASERDSLVKAGWKDEGTGWYASKVNS